MKKATEEKTHHIVMFVSRKKDNKDIEGFKGRNRSFLTDKDVLEHMEEFEDFVQKGLEGEQSRIYVTINSRKTDVIQKRLQHYLIDNPSTRLVRIESLIASFSMDSGSAKEKRFLLDFDSNDNDELKLFLKDVYAHVEKDLVSYSATPNGYAVITEQGFDTRKIMEKWACVELKRDGMKFIDIRKKETPQPKPFTVEKNKNMQSLLMSSTEVSETKDSDTAREKLSDSDLLEVQKWKNWVFDECLDKSRRQESGASVSFLRSHIDGEYPELILMVLVDELRKEGLRVRETMSLMSVLNGVVEIDVCWSEQATNKKESRFWKLFSKK